MCIAIRRVDENFTIFDKPVGLVQVNRTDANTPTATLKDVLLHCNLPLNLCRGQAYDGAANMSGHLCGVAAQVKSVEPAALDVHFLAHCLSLCLQNAGRICTNVCDSLELVMELVMLIKFSQKRYTHFQTLKSQMSPNTSDLRPLSNEMDSLQWCY